MLWMERGAAYLLLALAISTNFLYISCEILTPPYFNLAEGASISATATCGVNVTTSKERFCRLTGASADERQDILFSNLYYTGHSQIIAGQLCDDCFAEDHPEAIPSNVHSARFAIDGTERWWQSPPISRGAQYNLVNLTLDLGQEFHVAYVFIKMANSPRPGVWTLERSTDYGKTWSAWQYFADSPADCLIFFNLPAKTKPDSDHDVICTTEFSKIVPLEGGEIAVSLVQDRPGSNKFFSSQTLQQFTRATNIRLNLQRTKTLLGHLMLVQRQDPTVTRRYFYSIKDISIGGRCVCNGHADACDKKDQFKLVCDCQHNTCGEKCDSCCEPFVQKKWRPANETNVNACEPCQCFGHSEECVYDEEIDRLRLSIDIHGNYEGGGVCQNCRDNTAGINCDKCVKGYYRPNGRRLDDKNVCEPCSCDPVFTTGECEDDTGICKCKEQYTGPDCMDCAFGYFDPPECRPCDCYLNGTYGQVCQVGGGQCPCKPNYDGLTCGRCADGYWNFPECIPCQCQGKGSMDNNCDKDTGQCSCEFAFTGEECDKCQAGYYSYPECNWCNCDSTGTVKDICDVNSGQCICKPNYAGARCDSCAPGYFSYPECRPCQCDTTGTVNGSSTCNDQGQCKCLINFGGKKCSECAPGFYGYPNCKACGCSIKGSIGKSCDQTLAQCNCRPNFTGRNCSACAPNFYNYPTCEACLCNPAGAVKVDGYPLGGCGKFTDGFTLCQCKDNVEGHICDQCKPGFFGLRKEDPLGCRTCDCNLPGTLVGDNMCDPVSGKCLCKVNVNYDYCQACKPGTYNLQASSAFGCDDCSCDLGGSVSSICNNENGQCLCRQRVTGRTCNKPIENHYFPTLHQLKYELEDGYNPYEDDSAVRFGFDNTDFPDFSWKGYAVFSRIQPEVRVNASVASSSIFRLIFRYINNNMPPVKAQVVLTPEDPSEVVQTSSVNFPHTGRSTPEFLITSNSFVLNKGKWTISLKVDGEINVPSEILLSDYVVLLPQAYYEGGVLQERLRNPCLVPNDGQECLHYTYVDLTRYNPADGSQASRPDGALTNMETNRDILLPLDSPNLAILDQEQPDLEFNLTLKEPGQYVFVVGYVSPLNAKQELRVFLQPDGSNTTEAKVVLYDCQYSSLCRQVVMNGKGRKVLDSPSINVKVFIEADQNNIASIAYVVAIPKSEWEDDILKPEIACVHVNGQCVESVYPSLPDAVRVDAETYANKSVEQPPGVGDKKGLVKLDSTKTLNIPFRDLRSQTYAIVVNFHQPSDLGFPVNVTVDVNGVVYPGHFEADFCPNTAGCQRVVHFDKSRVPDNVLRVNAPRVVVSIKPLAGDDHDLWLDYVEIIPSSDTDTLKPLLETLDPYDHSVRYLAECTGSKYYIDAENDVISPFCRSAIFSVTTEYNNGALPCDCDARGSESFKCSEFGGQCRCKANVIGRQCDACAQNYYGFPDCKPCNCPATCNAVTGQCECPKRVTGPNCDQCAPMTFGYDRTIGCSDCNCRKEGVLNNNLNCDVDTGSCDCKPNVTGRKCEVCMNGFWNYPDCQECDCDPAGTLEGICDKDTSQCLCKTNTGGSSCGQCQPGTYNLEARNPLGCTKCFCFGITSSCQPSTLVRTKVMDMMAWGLINVNGTPDIIENGKTVTADISLSAAAEGSAMYWFAPITYLGNILTSYGGILSYKVSNMGVGRGDFPAKDRIPGPDVKIYGKGMTIVYNLLSPIMEEEIAIDILESSWVHAKSGSQVTREQFMSILSSVDELHIKANYYKNIPKVTLSSVTLDSAVPLNASNVDGVTAGVSVSLSSDIAVTVEMCACPPNYQGTSCEECADGFYKKLNEFKQFVCVPCECNGHSETCDRETGVCEGCRDNTRGEHCELCREGYNGNPELGEECIICACPMPMDSNNFATSCLISPIDSTSVIQCDCLPGFLGPICDTCAPGFYGDPRNTAGGRCVPCPCNGNIDGSNPGSCDNFSGDCLICLNDTQGKNCEECKDFYWGDAIESKNCRKCECDELGTDSCDKETGKCICKPNVVGDRCDRCAPDTWGFLSGNGCSFCNCSIASVDSQCNIATGACACQPGVTGRHCSSCLTMHWNFSPAGCTACECELDGAIRCNVLTGNCECLDGVTGEKCDRCENRWVLIPETGCQRCDNCVHTLLDETDAMQFAIANASSSLHVINIGVEAMKRLDQLNSTVHDVKKQLSDHSAKSVDPEELANLIKEIKFLKDELQKREDSTDKIAGIASASAKFYQDLLKKMDEAKTNKNDADSQLQGILDYIKKKHQDVLNSAELVNADRLLKEANGIIQIMNSRDKEFGEHLNKSHDVLAEANTTLHTVNEWEDRNANLTKRFDSISVAIDDASSRLNDLLKNAKDALNKSHNTDELLKKIKTMMDELLENTKAIKARKNLIDVTLENAAALAKAAEDYVTNASAAYHQLETDLTLLETKIDDLNMFFENLVVGNKNVKPVAEAAIEHARKLRNQADNLESLLRDTKEASAAAIKAANAYEMIVTSINRALNASNKALEAALKAIQQSTDIHNNTEQVRSDSKNLLKAAEQTKNDTSSDLVSKLDNSKKTIDGLQGTIEDIEQKHADAVFQLNNYKEDNAENANAAKELAANSKAKSEEAVKSVQPILNTLDSELAKMKEIPVLRNNISLELVQIKSKFKSINFTMPDVTSIKEQLMLKMLNLTASRNYLNLSINALKSKIESARATANRIKVALKSVENTFVELRTPEGFVDSLQQASELSLYFQTVQQDGLLLYIGPKAGTNTVQEYLALELENGQVVWKYNLGDKPAEIRSNKATYNDGKWHQVIASRSGKEGSLVVRTHDMEKDEMSGSTGGVYNQLDLTPQATSIFAAGVPPHFALPPAIVNRNFIGALDDISYSENNIILGLWNFVNGSANNDSIIDRGSELATVASDSVRFIADSNSYITISKGSLVAARTLMVTLTFKTLNTDGLLFFIGQDKSAGVDRPDYFKLFIANGKVTAVIELGGGEIVASNSVPVSDGKDHTINVRRQLNTLLLSVDNTIVNATKKGPTELNLGTNPELHLGGIPKDSKYFGSSIVAHPYYDGCISELTINQNKRNILVNYEAKVGTVPGCKLVKRVITFSEAPPDQKEEPLGFVMIDSGVKSVDENFTLGMKFKTLAEEGILFYTSDKDDANAFSVALTNGRVKVINTVGVDNQGRVRRNDVETVNAYNDGAWHHISVIKQALRLTVIVDDSQEVSKEAEHRGRKTRTDEDGIYYLAGLDVDRLDSITDRDNAASWKRFIGCLSHVSIENDIVDFAVFRPDGLNVDFSTCPIPDPIIPEVEEEEITSTFAEAVGNLVMETTTTAPLSCVLPVEPKTSNVKEEGIRFGLTQDSRLEFNSFAGIKTDIRSVLRLNNNVQLQLKTFVTDGMIWFIGAVEDNPDFSALYLEKGSVVFQSNLGGGSGFAYTTKKINDGQWHTIEFMRQRNNRAVSGYLTVDDETVPVNWPGAETSTALNVALPIYVGGLNTSDIRYKYMASKIGENSASSIVGCIDKIQYKEKDGKEWQDYGTETKNVNTQACFDNQEDGVFVPVIGGGLIVDKSIKVGTNTEVQIQVRPRSLSGVLLMIWGAGDYLGIELVNGTVKTNVNNGAGDIEVNVDVPQICDGKWHTISVLKRGSNVTLTVTSETTTLQKMNRGSTSSTAADTNSPIYVGGLPEEAGGSRYKPISGSTYVGCIRGVKVGPVVHNLGRARRFGEVALTCPTT